MTAKRKVETPQNAVNGTISADSTIGTSKCRACLTPLPPGSGLRRSCGGSCRLRAWAVEELKRALAAGEADGLKAEIKALVPAKLRVEVIHTGGRGTNVEDRRN